MAGLPVLKFLETTDPFERQLMLAIGEKVFEMNEIRDRNRAVLIANAVGKMLSGK